MLSSPMIGSALLMFVTVNVDDQSRLLIIYRRGLLVSERVRVVYFEIDVD